MSTCCMFERPPGVGCLASRLAAFRPFSVAFHFLATLRIHGSRLAGGRHVISDSNSAVSSLHLLQTPPSILSSSDRIHAELFKSM
jgi:hypothetical protein